MTYQYGILCLGVPLTEKDKVKEALKEVGFDGPAPILVWGSS